jgi:RNA polymerase sigma-70 factor (ECF subfamily)
VCVQDSRVTDRHSDAIETLYREAAPRLWRSLYLYAGNPDVASEAVAETFARALAAGNAVRQPERWIWRVAFRVAAAELKRGRRERQVTVETAYEMPEETASLVSALRRLTAKQRAAVILHYYEDLPLAEIAERMGATRSAAGVHLHRARTRLRELLGDDDG